MKEIRLDTEDKYNISLPELQQFNDIALSTLLMYSDRDRATDYKAMCTYWMCIMEINRRDSDFFPESMEVRCKGNILDDGKIRFKRDGIYTLYAVDQTMLVYDEEMRPVVFNMIDRDDMCIWTRFGMVQQSDGEYGLLS